jgi:HK97 family phage major capsid protein
MIKACSWGLDMAAFQGTGAGQPLGCLLDPALVVCPKETGQQAATITYTNIVTMFSRLHPSCMKGAVWVAHSSTLPSMLILSVGVGTAGVLMPAVKESSGTFSLLGMPSFFTEKLNVIGQQGDVLLANFQNYVLGLRKDLVLEVSNAPGWGRDVLSYRVILRADGFGKWNKAITPRVGSTRSWIVTLAAR